MARSKRPIQSQNRLHVHADCSHWEAICNRGLQIAGLEEVLRKLFGKGKAKKYSKHGSESETDPTNSRQVEESKTESLPGEQIETPSNSERVENHEPDQDQLTPEQEQEEKPNERSHEMEAADHEDKPSQNAPKESRQNHSQEHSEDAVSNAKNKFVIAIKNPRVNDYLQGMMDDLLKARRKRGFLEKIYPEEIRDFVTNEDSPARIILELVHFELDREKRLNHI